MRSALRWMRCAALLIVLLALAAMPAGRLSAQVAGDSGAPAGRKTAPINLIWSSDDVHKTPRGDLEFHGPFNNENLTVTRENLEAHSFLEISFDLLILRTWDGSVPVDEPTARPVQLGPDFFRFGIADGPTLLYTTFSNTQPGYHGFHAESKSQNYPSQVPGDHFAPQAGAAAVNTMGYHYPFPNAPGLFPMDATYHIRFIVPHQDYDVILQFSAMNLQPMVDENWGIAHLEIHGINGDQVPHPAASEISSAFAACCDTSAKDPVGAFQTLINGMEDTVNFIEKDVKPQPVNGANTARLIRDLYGDDINMAARENAGLQLYHMGPQTEPQLRDARKTAVGEERQRIDWVLSCIGVRPINDDDTRKVMLATRVLEIIGTPHALKVRKALTEE